MVSRRSFIGAMARTFVLGTPAVALAGKASSEAFDEVNAEIDDVLFICEGDADCFVDVAPEIRRQIRVFDKAGAFKGREAQRARERVKAELADLKAQGPSEATDDPVAAGRSTEADAETDGLAEVNEAIEKAKEICSSGHSSCFRVQRTRILQLIRRLRRKRRLKPKQIRKILKRLKTELR